MLQQSASQISERTEIWDISGIFQFASAANKFLISSSISAGLAIVSAISARNNSNFFAGNPMDAILRSGDVVVVPEKALKIGGPNWSVIMQAASVAASAAIAVAYIHP